MPLLFLFSLGFGFGPIFAKAGEGTIYNCNARDSGYELGIYRNIFWYRDNMG